MEKVRDIYRKLFSVNFPHEGSTAERDWIRVNPMPDTREIMSHNKMIFKKYPGGFMVVVKTKNEAGKENQPLYGIEGMELVFGLGFADKVIAAETALPLKTGKKYVFSNKRAFDGGVNSSSLALKPLGGPATLAGEIVKETGKLWLAGIDFSAAGNPPPLKVTEIPEGEYAVTGNWEDDTHPLLKDLPRDHFGVIHILVGKQAALGNKYKLLLAGDEVSPKDFEVRVMKMI